jgi:hypothetical protein
MEGHVFHSVKKFKYNKFFNKNKDTLQVLTDKLCSLIYYTTSGVV